MSDREQQASLRRRLQDERSDTVRRIAEMTEDFNGVVRAAADAGTDDEHDPEGQTIAYERAQLAAMLDQARTTLAELNRALDRLEDGSFGRCECCGSAIPTARLDARPTARTCMTCATTKAQAR